MRLHLAGAKVGDRARQLAPAWEKHNEDFVSLFYDGHNCFNSLLAGDRAARDKLLDNMRDFISDNRTVEDAYLLLNDDTYTLNILTGME